MNVWQSESAREWTIVGAVYLVLLLVAAVWLAVDRTPPEWDHANHLERVVHCAEDMRERKKYGQPGARQKFQYSKR